MESENVIAHVQGHPLGVDIPDFEAYGQVQPPSEANAFQGHDFLFE